METNLGDTHEYQRTFSNCTCVYGLPPIKRDCPVHGRLVRSVEERESGPAASAALNGRASALCEIDAMCKDVVAGNWPAEAAIPEISKLAASATDRVGEMLATEWERRSEAAKQRGTNRYGEGYVAALKTCAIQLRNAAKHPAP